VSRARVRSGGWSRRVWAGGISRRGYGIGNVNGRMEVEECIDDIAHLPISSIPRLDDIPVEEIMGALSVD